MTVPVQNIIHILKEDRESIINKLKTYQYGQVPFLVDISTLEDQKKILAIIETFCENNEIYQVPVPLAVLCNVTNYKGNIKVISDYKEFPKFFVRKNKPLNVKESRLSVYYSAKCELFQNVDFHKASANLSTYSKQHENLFHLSSEGEFLELLLKKIRKTG